MDGNNGYYKSDSITVDDVLYVASPAGCVQLSINTINSKTGGILNADVTDLNGTLTTVPLGIGAVLSATSNNYPTMPYSVPEPLRSCLFTDLANKIDADVASLQTQVDSLPTGTGLAQRVTVWETGSTLTYGGLTDDGSVLQIDTRTMRLWNRTTATLPTPSLGDMVFNTSFNLPVIYNGTAWATNIQDAGVLTNNYVPIWNNTAKRFDNSVAFRATLNSRIGLFIPNNTFLHLGGVGGSSDEGLIISRNGAISQSINIVYSDSPVGGAYLNGPANFYFNTDLFLLNNNNFEVQTIGSGEGFFITNSLEGTSINFTSDANGGLVESSTGDAVTFDLETRISVSAKTATATKIAGFGANEELTDITLGSNLSLTSGTLNVTGTYTGFTPAADAGSGSNVASAGTLTITGTGGATTSVSGTTVTVDASAAKDTFYLADGTMVVNNDTFPNYLTQDDYLPEVLNQQDVTIDANSNDLVINNPAIVNIDSRYISGTRWYLSDTYIHTGETDDYLSDLDIDGSLIIGGNHLADQFAGDAGLIYAYEINNSDIVFDDEYNNDPAPTVFDYVGFYVSVNSNRVLASQHVDEVMQVFVWNGTSLVSTQRVTPDVSDTGGNWGRGMAAGEEYAIIGSYFDDPGAVSNAGSAYLYKWDNTANTLVYQHKITALTPTANDEMGREIALKDSLALISGRLSGKKWVARIDYALDTAIVTQELSGFNANFGDVSGAYIVAPVANGWRLYEYDWNADTVSLLQTVTEGGNISDISIDGTTIAVSYLDTIKVYDIISDQAVLNSRLVPFAGFTMPHCQISGDYIVAEVGALNRLYLYKRDNTTDIENGLRVFENGTEIARFQSDGVKIWDRYFLPGTSPSTATLDTNIIAWIGTGSAATPAFIPYSTSGGGSGDGYFPDTLAVKDVAINNDGHELLLGHENNSGTHYYDLTLGFPVNYGTITNYNYSTPRLKLYGDNPEFDVAHHADDRSIGFKKLVSGQGYITHGMEYNSAGTAFRPQVASTYQTVIGLDALNNGRIIFAIAPTEDTVFNPLTDYHIMTINADSSITHHDYGTGNQDVSAAFSRVAVHDSNNKLKDVGFTQLADSLRNVYAITVAQTAADTILSTQNRLVKNLQASTGGAFANNMSMQGDSLIIIPRAGTWHISVTAHAYNEGYSASFGEGADIVDDSLNPILGSYDYNIEVYPSNNGLISYSRSFDIQTTGEKKIGFALNVIGSDVRVNSLQISVHEIK